MVSLRIVDGHQTAEEVTLSAVPNDLYQIVIKLLAVVRLSQAGHPDRMVCAVQSQYGNRVKT